MAGATETITTDGEWWNNVPPASRSLVMFGATSAFESGFLAGADAALAGIDEVTYHAKTLSDKQKAELAIGSTVVFTRLNRPDFSGKPIRAYIDGTDYFYSRHPEAVGTDFGDVLKCIQNKPTETCDELASWYVKYRKHDSGS